jgi:hypothetical protein
MPQKLTTIEYNMENWREATKDWSFVMYSSEELGEMSGTLYPSDVSSLKEPYGRIDSEHNLSKVSQKSDIPIGENIRDAIRSIKGR